MNLYEISDNEDNENNQVKKKTTKDESYIFVHLREIYILESAGFSGIFGVWSRSHCQQIRN